MNSIPGNAETSVADDILRNGYDRWLRLEEEKAAIGEDLKELFAELKANGFTPKALRESFRRVRNIDDADQQEHDAIVDLYVASLTGAGRARTREEAGHDPETGEITEPQETKVPAQMQVDAGASAGLTSKDRWTSLPGAEGIADREPILPETANEMDRDVQQGDAEAAVPAENARKAIPVTEGGSVIHAGAGESPATLSRADRIKQLRPHCQFPERCGSSGGKAHCFRCRQDAGIAA